MMNNMISGVTLAVVLVALPALADSTPNLFRCTQVPAVQDKWEPSERCDINEATQRVTSIIRQRCEATGGKFFAAQRSLACEVSTGRRAEVTVSARSHRMGTNINIMAWGDMSLLPGDPQPSDVRRLFGLDCASAGGAVSVLNRVRDGVETVFCKFADYTASVGVGINSSSPGFTLNLWPVFDSSR